MKKNKFLPYVIFGVPVAIGLYFIYKAVKKSVGVGKNAPNSYNPNIENNQTTTNTNGGTTPKVAQYFPLKRGSKGGKVIELQNAILKYDNTLLGSYGADGDFGGLTETAVKTILGKTTVDSQDDIDSIIKKADENKKNAETKAQVENTVAQRKALAYKLVDAVKKDKSLDFRAITKTSVGTFYVTTDGRWQFTKSNVFDSGTKIETSGYKQLFVDTDGYIALAIPTTNLLNLGFLTPLVSNSNQNIGFTLSPYAFETY